MNQQNPLSLAGKLTVASLIVAAAGVVIQIISGHPYPPIPPVFFILLIPAGLIALGRWRWTPVTAVLAGLFLTFGLLRAASQIACSSRRAAAMRSAYGFRRWR